MKVICPPVAKVMPLGASNCSDENDILCMSRACRQRRDGSRGMVEHRGIEPRSMTVGQFPSADHQLMPHNRAIIAS